MNIASNPWNFVPGDIISATITTLTQQTPNNAIFNLVTAAALALAPGQFVTIVGANQANGWYKILSGVMGGTAFVLQNLSTPTQGSPINYSGASQAAGTVLWNQYQANIRAEDISWQGPTTLQANTLSILDRNGNLIWNAATGSTAITGNAQNRGKIMWVDGFTLQTLTSGTVLVTVN